MAKQSKKSVSEESLPTEQLAEPAIEVTTDYAGENEKLKAEITALKQVIHDFEHDAMYSIYFANNRKANEWARLINNFDLSDAKQAKSYADMVTKQPVIVEALHKLRNDFLKIDEKKLEDIERRGVPLIELNGKKPA